MKEVTTNAQFTPIPHAPDVVVGYVNIRGQIILALDLARLVGWENQGAEEISTSNCLVIFKSFIGPQFGIMVDRVGEVIHLPPKTREPYRPEPNDKAMGQARSELIESIGKLEDQLVVLLDTPKLLPLVERLTVFTARPTMDSQYPRPLPT
jgi:purine-binding chemotaxis protein CheW